MLILRKGKLYEDTEPLQEQLPLKIAEAQEEFVLEDENPELVEKLRTLNEQQTIECTTGF